MTLVDLAAVLRPLELEAALANALRLRLVRLAKLRQFVTATPTSTPGRAQLSDLLEQRQPIRDTRSIYERKLLELIAAAELPQPLTNATVAGHMVDLFWPQERLVVEFDGWAYHNGRGAFETDRRRDQDLLGIGVRVARVTARQIDDTPYAAVARLARALRCD